jgi:hypothetical protein
MSLNVQSAHQGARVTFAFVCRQNVTVWSMLHAPVSHGIEI